MNDTIKGGTASARLHRVVKGPSVQFCSFLTKLLRHLSYEDKCG